MIVPEQLIEQHFDVMSGMPVEMNVDRTRRLEQPTHLFEPRPNELEIAVHPARPAIVHFVGACGTGVLLAGEERGIGIDQIAVTVGQVGHQRQVVGANQPPFTVRFARSSCHGA